MHNPVVLSDGHSYEQRHIERWLQEHSTSPVSNEELKHTTVFPNHALRNAIEEYFAQIFSVHRRAIKRTIRDPQSQQCLATNEPLLCTIDALMQCSFLMNADLNTECVLRQIMQEAKALLGAEVASVFLVDAARRELYSTVNSTGGELRIPLRAGIAGHVATTGEPLVIDDVYGDDRFDRTTDEMTGFRTENMMCVPLKVRKGGIIGVVQLINKTGTGVFCRSQALAPIAEKQTDFNESVRFAFTPNDLQFLQVFASQAATAVANSGALLREGEVSQTLEETEQQTSGLWDIMRCCVARPTSSSKHVDSQAGVDHAKSEENLDKPPRWRSEEELATERVLSSLSTTTEEDGSPRWRSHISSETNAADVASVLKEAFSSWQFDALILGELTANRPLSTLAVHLLEECGIVHHLSLDRVKLQTFFIAIENGYDDANPYHNRAHAASVMHSMHALLEHGGISKATSAAFQGSRGAACATGHLERLACIFAAAVHDHEHLGFSNDFLVRIGDKRAMTYNDQHVNEHHHVASAFAVLRRPECNFLSNLPGAEFRRFRRLVIELVIGTDMANSGKILKSFNKSFGVPASGGAPSQTVPASEKDAVLLLQMAMKCADLGHLALDWDVHVSWVARLESEFFAQGDKEKALGHSVSFLMDRDQPGCTKTQVGFFEFVVIPIFRSLVSVAPLAQPVLDAVNTNCERWRSLEAPVDV